MPRRTAVYLAGLTSFAALAACTAPAPTRTPRVADDPSYVDDDLVPITPDRVIDDSGANIGTRPRGTDDGGDSGLRTNNATDAGANDANTGDASDRDAGGPLACTTPAGPGDLLVVELMVAFKTGTNDKGEWIELRNTRDCTLSLSGVSIESPRSTAAADRITIAEGTVAAGASILIADVRDPVRDRDLAGRVFTFGTSDVLKNDGDSVRVLRGTVTIDAITYPRNNVPAGTSLSFPSDCAGIHRTDYARWSRSVRSYAPGVFGTPGTSNDDVTCF
jgi:hypothetical protein